MAPWSFLCFENKCDISDQCLAYSELSHDAHIEESKSYTGWPLTWKSQGIPKWSGRSQRKWKSQGRGEVKSGVFFQVLNTPKVVFRPGLRPGPRWGSLRRSPRPWNNDSSVDHIGKHSILGNLCLPVLDKSGNFMWSGKWSPCIYSTV